MNPVASIALVLVLLGGLMLGVRALQASGRVGPEMGRKLVHLGMGTVCLAFPWIFNSPAPVWALALVSAGGLTAVRLAPALQARLGGVLGGVQRHSLGELYFPFAVALVFTLPRQDLAAYCGPVAILTYADAAGALVGQRWGRRRYPAVESTKSLEGSAAVFGVTCFAVTLVLVLLSSVGWGAALLIGFTLGLFASLVEAVSWRGLDNLLVPVVAYAQLRIYPTMPWRDLAGCAVVMIALAVYMLNWRRNLLDTSARLGTALAMYLFWSLGDWRWLVAPAVLLASLTRLMPTVPGGPERHNLAAVVCVGSSALAWAVANAIEPHPRWLWLYTLAMAAQQGIVALVRFSQGRPHWPRWAWWAVATVQAAGVQTIAFLVANGAAALPVRDAAIGAVALALALAGFAVWDRNLALPDDLNGRWWRQGITAALASTAGFVLIGP